MEAAGDGPSGRTAQAPELVAVGEDMKTYFGLTVIREKFVRQADIEALPFAEFWRESAVGSGTMVDHATGETLIYIHDWERFSRLFIETGKHRFSS